MSRCLLLPRGLGKLFSNFSHLRELEGHLRRHLLGGNIVLLLVQEVLHALLVNLDFHLHIGGIVVGHRACDEHSGIKQA